MVCESVGGDWKFWVWAVVVLLMVDWWVHVVDGGSVGGDWKVLGGLMGGCVVDGWVDLGLGGGCVVDGWVKFLC